MTHDRQERSAAELIEAGSRLRPQRSGESLVHRSTAARRDARLFPSLARPTLPICAMGGPGQASIRDPVKVPVPQLRPDHRVVPLQQVTPGPIPELGGTRGRPHDVREQHSREEPPSRRSRLRLAHGVVRSGTKREATVPTQDGVANGCAEAPTQNEEQLPRRQSQRMSPISQTSDSATGARSAKTGACPRPEPVSEINVSMQRSTDE
jgi:hypothetical protein